LCRGGVDRSDTAEPNEMLLLLETISAPGGSGYYYYYLIDHLAPD
jgi:hypothetical protein